MTARRRRSKLLGAWMVASAVYVLVAAGFSVTPIRHALTAADRAAPPPVPATSSGPVPEAPDPPAVTIAKAVGKQALVVFAPPALALWFGWDVWFAVTGFFPRRDRIREAEGQGAEEPEA
jgi:hypothetical protein